MKTAVSTKVLIQGLVRSPDREGALAHLDPDRGFAFVGRGAMSFADVIDPTIWVREKLSLSLGGDADSHDPQLRRAIATLRSLHADLMSRADRERTWISVLVVLFRDGEGMALTAGDCPCYRFRAGVLSRLGRVTSENPAAPPEGSLGSEAQVRLEMVPLNAQPGDCYILSTHPLGEGELSLLARDLASARDVMSLLRTACSGTQESGRVAFAAVTGAHDPMPRTVSDEPAEMGPLELEPLEPLPSARMESRAPSLESAGAFGDAAESEPEAARFDPTYPIEGPSRAESLAPEGVPAEGGLGEETPAGETADAGGAPSQEWDARGEARDVAIPPPPSMGAFVERRPWYEWIALWGGGALAIIALALLIRAIMPGIVGAPRPGA